MQPKSHGDCDCGAGSPLDIGPHHASPNVPKRAGYPVNSQGTVQPKGAHRAIEPPGNHGLMHGQESSTRGVCLGASIEFTI